MDLEILDRKIRRLQCKLKKYNIDLEVFEPADIEYGAILGKGGEGLVQKCCVTYNNIPVDAAVKTVTSKGEEDDEAINITLDEIELLCLGNDHILDCTLRVYGVAAIPDENDPEMGYLAIITEAGLMNALQLYQEEEIPLHVNLDLWSRMAAAVHCLHNKKIIHHDLKPENILITGIMRNKFGQIEKLLFKIIDLGMGRRLYAKKIVTDDILGTNGYHPPEVLLEDSYDFRADVFMLGVTFCVLLHAKSFLQSNQLQSLLRKMHLSKKRGVAGEQLYAAVLEHHITDTHDEISPLIRSMLCNMLETQEHRNIALERVVDICREESEREKARIKSLPPALTPANSTYCQDSGFGSGEGSAGDGNSKRNQRDLPNRGRLLVQSDSLSHTRNSSADKPTRVPNSRKRRRCSSANNNDTDMYTLVKRPRGQVTRSVYGNPVGHTGGGDGDENQPQDEDGESGSEEEDEDNEEEESSSSAESEEQRKSYCLREHIRGVTLFEAVPAVRRKMPVRRAKEYCQSPVRGSPKFRKRKATLHGTTSSLPNSDSSDEEEKYEGHKTRSMVESRRCLPTNLSREDVSRAILRDRIKIGSSLPDVDPVNVDQSVDSGRKARKQRRQSASPVSERTSVRIPQYKRRLRRIKSTIT